MKESDFIERFARYITGYASDDEIYQLYQMAVTGEYDDVLKSQMKLDYRLASGFEYPEYLLNLLLEALKNRMRQYCKQYEEDR